MTDPISDMLIRIKNAQLVHAERVLVPASKIKQSIATILQKAGYVANVEHRTRKMKKSEQDYLDLGLQYTDGVGAISGLKIVSKPSRHLYIKAKDIKLVRSGHGMAVLSTPQGVMTSQEARKQGIGGEVLFEIW